MVNSLKKINKLPQNIQSYHLEKTNLSVLSSNKEVHIDNKKQASSSLEIELSSLSVYLDSLVEQLFERTEQ